MIALLVTLLAPAVGALATVALATVALRRAGTTVALVFAVVSFLASLWLLTYRSVGVWVSLDVAWVPALDLRFHIGVDGISYPLVVLTSLLSVLCASHVRWLDRSPGLAALLLVIQSGIIGVFLALDLVLFFVFFEIVLLPMWAVIAFWGDDGRRAARRFVLYTLLGSVLLLVGVFTVVVGAGTADLVALTSGAGAAMSPNTQLIAFILLALAFAVKSPLWPLHSWLPDAHTRAPTVGSVILAGVLLKMGTYGLIRVAVGSAPAGAATVAPVLGVLAVAAIIAGGLVCLAQTDLKRLIAYSSVGHMGFVLLGIATLSVAGLQAALVGNIAHGVITALLFFLVGGLKSRTHAGGIDQLGGLRESAPVFAGVLGFAAIASLGLPGLAGFWGEAFAVVASFARGGPLWIVLGSVAALGAALAAAYFLRLLRHISHAPPARPVIGPTGVELVMWSPLILLALVVGILPALVTALSAAPVEALVSFL